MPKGAIARRYAAAIFDIAQKQGTIDRTLSDVEGIAQVYSDRKLSFLLREPKIPAQRKETAVRQALASQVLPTSLNLALLVIQRELVEVMPNIASELKQMVMDYKNEAVAQVTTATRMDDAEQKLIKQALEDRTHKTIIMETRVDPSILGGVIARVGDQLIDGSVRTRLSLLQHQLLNDVAAVSASASDWAGTESADTMKQPETPTQTPPEETVESTQRQ
ncbi:MAG TPA: ATP synthase F1 subunit delta [Ktedonobacteraceae bacterium]|nr:ATP synthase F1 subunit delta [Ktedonobacteraceae bacterium]